MKKTLLLITIFVLLVSCSMAANQSAIQVTDQVSSVSPIILELHDHKSPTRRLIVRADGSYEFKEATGGRIYRGFAEFEKSGKCKLIINHVEAQHSLTVNADTCHWVGTATLTDLSREPDVSYELNDITVNTPPKK